MVPFDASLRSGNPSHWARGRQFHGFIVGGGESGTTIGLSPVVADGAEAAQFLMEIKRLLENPVSLVL